VTDPQSVTEQQLELDGCTALVTGGASGIGLATARLLSSRGALVAVLDRTAGDASGGASGDLAAAVRLVADISDAASVRAAFDGFPPVFDRLDILVNCAGVGAVGDVEEATDEEWQRVLDVNVVGVARVTSSALPRLRRSARPSIVNVCSVVADVGLPRRAVYSASKGAVHALTRAMAVDCLSDRIRVNCVHPGTADTPWVQRLLDAADDPIAERAALEARQPMGRLVTADEVAHAVLYLSAPGAGSVTGTTLTVDGGLVSLRPVRPRG
jgi:NAD(P)-dependent dehydrogenase (short-subunit alcohol dehydrogenase family)